jgi:hypothetical protein
MSSVLQEWVMKLPMMQQSVLLSAMRGPDGVSKHHPSKGLCKWFRRCIVISAFDKRALDNPYDKNGGSYTGPSILEPDNGDWEEPMNAVAKEFMGSQDNLPQHYYLHMLHAFEIVGYKHSDERIRRWWNQVYQRLAHDMHFHGETEAELDARLNDDEAAWRKDITRFKPTAA